MLDTLDEVAAYWIETTQPTTIKTSEGADILFQSAGNLHTYCRPDCPSLHPHRATARRFMSRAAAAEAGLRPCGWCRPDSDRPTSGPRPTAIRRAGRTMAALFGALVFLP